MSATNINYITLQIEGGRLHIVTDKIVSLTTLSRKVPVKNQETGMYVDTEIVTSQIGLVNGKIYTVPGDVVAQLEAKRA